MEIRLKSYLFDIVISIDEIYTFFLDVPKRFDEYEKNLMLRRAVERNIGIIGEAVNKISKEFPEVKITNARDIVATRNRVIHDYAAVSDDVIWKIVVKDLPALKAEAMTLLHSEDTVK